MISFNQFYMTHGPTCSELRLLIMRKILTFKKLKFSNILCFWFDKMSPQLINYKNILQVK